MDSIPDSCLIMSMAVEKGAKTAVVWLLFTLPLSLLEGGVLSERPAAVKGAPALRGEANPSRSEEHTSELQSRLHLVCRLLLEKKTLRLHTSSSKPLSSMRTAAPAAMRPWII